MIVVPKRIGKREYFNEIITHVKSKLKVARKIPIVPWEDLIEN